MSYIITSGFVVFLIIFVFLIIIKFVFLIIIKIITKKTPETPYYSYFEAEPDPDDETGKTVLVTTSLHPLSYQIDHVTSVRGAYRIGMMGRLKNGLYQFRVNTTRNAKNAAAVMKAQRYRQLHPTRYIDLTRDTPDRLIHLDSEGQID